MRYKDTAYFEYKASVLDEKCVDEEELAKELERTLKECLLHEIEANFKEIPYSYKTYSRVNENGKLENNYIIEVILINPDTYYKLLEKQAKLEMLLAKKTFKRNESDIDDWISGKKIQ